MASTLPSGDFSRATRLSVKMLRHYHEIGLLEPLDDIHAVLDATDVETRNQVITTSPSGTESGSDPGGGHVPARAPGSPAGQCSHRSRHLGAAPAAVITDIVGRSAALASYHGAIGELAASLAPQNIDPTGPAGGVFDTELFTDDRGRATIFLPCGPSPRPVGRVSIAVIPPAELTTIVHPGLHTDIDRTYGALAAYVTRHALAVDGPVREYYLVGPSETRDESLWRTEVGWPISETRPRRQ